MYDGRTHTLEEVGQIFGVTRERIRQIENKAIRKLRHPSRAKKDQGFLLLNKSPGTKRLRVLQCFAVFTRRLDILTTQW